MFLHQQINERTCFLPAAGLLWRPPTAGLPPDVLPLSGVLFSQSLMRPATPVLITAASCLDRGVIRAPSFIFLVPAWVCIVGFLFYLKHAPTAPRWAEHVAFLPHALDVPHVGDQREVWDRGARSPRLLVFSLRRRRPTQMWQTAGHSSKWGFIEKTINIFRAFF